MLPPKILTGVPSSSLEIPKVASHNTHPTISENIFAASQKVHAQNELTQKLAITFLQANKNANIEYHTESYNAVRVSLSDALTVQKSGDDLLAHARGLLNRPKTGGPELTPYEEKTLCDRLDQYHKDAEKISQLLKHHLESLRSKLSLDMVEVAKMVQHGMKEQAGEDPLDVPQEQARLHTTSKGQTLKGKLNELFIRHDISPASLCKTDVLHEGFHDKLYRRAKSTHFNTLECCRAYAANSDSDWDVSKQPVGQAMDASRRDGEGTSEGKLAIEYKQLAEGPTVLAKNNPSTPHRHSPWEDIGCEIGRGGEAIVYESLDGENVYKKFDSMSTKISGFVESETDCLNKYYGSGFAEAIFEDGYNFIKMKKLDGFPLSAAHKRSLPSSVLALVKDSLNRMELLGIHHQDLQTKNFIYSEAENKVYPVDIQSLPEDIFNIMNEAPRYNMRKNALLKAVESLTIDFPSPPSSLSSHETSHYSHNEPHRLEPEFTIADTPDDQTVQSEVNYREPSNTLLAESSTKAALDLVEQVELVTPHIRQ